MGLSKFFLMLPFAASLVPGQTAAPGDWTVFVGTYTRQKSEGIYAYRFQAAGGKLTPLGLAAKTENPSFLAVHPNQRFLYAANETDTYQGQAAGSISAYGIDASTGKLRLLNQVSSRGAAPCHLTLDKQGHWLFVANYNGGSIAVFPVHEDGSLGEASGFVQHSGSSIDKERQTKPHAHSVYPSSDDHFIFAADLGLDEVTAYRFDTAKGSLTPNRPPYTKITPGSGPRHLAFRPDGHFAYALNEMAATVTAMRYDASHGSMEAIQTVSTLPDGFTGAKSGAEIAMHPNGKFLYASNRGHDSIAVFGVDPAKGTLTAVDRTPTQGKTPRNFAIDPTGAYLFAANQDSDSIVSFAIDQKTGKLTATGNTYEVPLPVCITFVRAR